MSPQEMQAAIAMALAEAEKQLLPAKLKVTQANANAVIAEVTRVHGVGSPAIYKSETYYQAFKALYRTLDWAVPPAKLVAELRNERIATIPSAIESENIWSEKVKRAEARDVKRAADAASIKRAKDLIAGFNPISRGMYDHREREDAQKLWTAKLNETIEKKHDLQEFAVVLAAAIQKRYKDKERERENM